LVQESIAGVLTAMQLTKSLGTGQCLSKTPDRDRREIHLPQPAQESQPIATKTLTLFQRMFAD